MTTEASVNIFFSSPSVAVVGASANTAKVGHKVLAWYLDHNIAVIPINPSVASIHVPSLGREVATIPDLGALPDPKETSVSIITPPAVTRKVLEQAKNLGIPAVWLQPGTFDEEVLAYARKGEGEESESGTDEKGFKAVVAGFGGGTVGKEGWCVLVDGERGLKAVGKL